MSWSHSFYVYPYRAGAPAFAGALAAGASWLKNVVAVKLETTLSEGEYLNVFFTFASPGLAVVDNFILLILMMRSSLFTRSKKFRPSRTGHRYRCRRDLSVELLGVHATGGIATDFNTRALRRVLHQMKELVSFLLVRHDLLLDSELLLQAGHLAIQLVELGLILAQLLVLVLQLSQRDLRLASFWSIFRGLTMQN